MITFPFLLSLVAAPSVANGTDHLQPQPAEYSVNFDSRRALEWHNLEAPITRGLVIAIVVNGRTIRAALDSGTHGAGLLQIRTGLARELGVVPSGAQISSQTYGGSTSQMNGVASSVVIGGVTFSNAPVGIESLNGFDDDVEAVIGSEILKSVTLVIDPGNKRVRLLLPGELAGLKLGGNVVALEDNLHTRASSVEVTLCGNKTKMLVDTGANGDLSLRAALFKRAQCKTSVDSDVRSETAAGPIIHRRTGVPDAEIQTTSLGPVLVQEIADSRADAVGIDGAVGLGVLGRFVSAIDVASRRLAILGAAPDGGGIERPRIGLQVRRTRDSLEILHVEAGSPASRSTIKVGDRICEVDGVPMSTLGEHFNTNPAAGVELRLTTCGGRNVSITASDFLFPPAANSHLASNAFPPTRIGDFTQAMNDCLYGNDKGKQASCSKVIDAPPETRSIGDVRIPAYLYRAIGETATGDPIRAAEDYRHVLELDPDNARAKAALGGGRP